jgi:hypothetical protein
LFESEDPEMTGWFTYFLDEATIADKFKKLEAIKQAKRNALKKTVLEDLKVELAKFTLMAAKPPPPKGC